MTSEQLMHAAMLALTKQNMAYKLSPLSTATHSGMCINRNITAGETVGLYYNGGGSLLRMGDVPGYSSDFWVDDDNRFYTIDNSTHRLIVKDGLSGDVLDDTIDAYGFVVAGTRTCCAFKSSQDENEWVVVMPDGTMSDPISILSSHNWTPSFGFRNGIIGVCVGSSGDRGVDAYTYYASGQYIATMQKGRELGGVPELVLPISASAVGYANTYATIYINLRRCVYSVATTVGYATYDMWSEYSVDSIRKHTSSIWLGADQSYVYVSARHLFVDPDEGTEEWTDEYYTGRFSIDDYNGLELLRTEISDASPYSSTSASQKGTIVHTITSGEISDRIMLDLSTMTEVYGDVFASIPANPIIRENDGFIWISGLGVYQKTPNGWLMYPTSEYPRNDDNQLLGYAIRNVKVGNEGLAIVLFE